MKIKISKKQWELIGKKAQWTIQGPENHGNENFNNELITLDNSLGNLEKILDESGHATKGINQRRCEFLERIKNRIMELQTRIKQSS